VVPEEWAVREDRAVQGEWEEPAAQEDRVVLEG